MISYCWTVRLTLRPCFVISSESFWKINTRLVNWSFNGTWKLHKRMVNRLARFPSRSTFSHYTRGPSKLCQCALLAVGFQTSALVRCKRTDPHRNYRSILIKSIRKKRKRREKTEPVALPSRSNTPSLRSLERPGHQNAVRISRRPVGVPTLLMDSWNQ